MPTADALVELTNKNMIAFDLALGAGAIVAPDAVLRLLGHAAPSDDARELFRRCGPIWLTFAAAHAVAAKRGSSNDWWAVAWLRGTELATDVLWSRSPGFGGNPRAKASLIFAGVFNGALALGAARRAGR